MKYVFGRPGTLLQELFKHVHFFAALVAVGGCMAVLSTSIVMASTKSTKKLNSKNQTSKSIVQRGHEKNTSSETSQKKWEGGWKLKLGSYNFSEALDETSTVKTKMELMGLYKVNQFLEVYGEGGIGLSSGRVQQKYKTGNGDDGSIYIKDAQVKLKAPALVELHMGVQSQDYFSNGLFVDRRRSMPGIREIVQTKIGRLALSLQAQQSIPTSSSFESDRRDKEALPSFTTETLRIVYGDESTFMEPFVYLTHYKFSELPSIVAFESKTMGNTVSGTVVGDSSFLFEFEGVVGFMGSGFHLTKWLEVNLAYHTITNNQAPTGFNRSEGIAGSLNMKLPYMTIKPKISQFYIESDAVPGFYNSAGVGHTNRKGTLYKIDFEFPKQSFKIVASTTTADVINSNVDQDKLSSTYLGLEMINVSF